MRSLGERSEPSRSWVRGSVDSPPPQPSPVKEEGDFLLALVSFKGEGESLNRKSARTGISYRVQTLDAVHDPGGRVIDHRQPVSHHMASGMEPNLSGCTRYSMAKMKLDVRTSAVSIRSRAAVNILDFFDHRAAHLTVLNLVSDAYPRYKAVSHMGANEECCRHGLHSSADCSKNAPPYWSQQGVSNSGPI